MKAQVYIVIVNYNGWQDTVECLESILRLTYDHYQVFVVDNNSPNDSVEKLVQWAEGTLPYTYSKNNTLKDVFHQPRRQKLTYRVYEQAAFEANEMHEVTPLLSIIKADANKGFAAGNNVVIQKLRQQEAFVWLLNPDMVTEADTLSKLVEFSSDHPRRTIVGTPVRSYSDPTLLLNYGCGRVNSFSGTISFIKSEKEIPTLEYISGGSLFTHAANFMELGLMEETYFLYWEETDWCFKANRAGYKQLLCQDAIVYDKISTSIGKGYLAEYYYTLNSLRFFKKYKSTYIPFVLTSNLLRLAKRIFARENLRAKAIIVATKDYLSLEN
jgi:GT2 family glycosyltransferase